MGLFDSIKNLLGGKKKDPQPTQGQQNFVQSGGGVTAPASTQQIVNSIPKPAPAPLVDVPLTQQQVNQRETASPYKVPTVDNAFADIRITQAEKDRLQRSMVINNNAEVLMTPASNSKIDAALKDSEALLNHLNNGTDPSGGSLTNKNRRFLEEDLIQARRKVTDLQEEHANKYGTVSQEKDNSSFAGSEKFPGTVDVKNDQDINIQPIIDGYMAARKEAKDFAKDHLEEKTKGFLDKKRSQLGAGISDLGETVSIRGSVSGDKINSRVTDVFSTPAPGLIVPKEGGTVGGRLIGSIAGGLFESPAKAVGEGLDSIGHLIRGNTRESAQAGVRSGINFWLSAPGGSTILKGIAKTNTKLGVKLLKGVEKTSKYGPMVKTFNESINKGNSTLKSFAEAIKTSFKGGGIPSYNNAAVVKTGFRGAVEKGKRFVGRVTYPIRRVLYYPAGAVRVLNDASMSLPLPQAISKFTARASTFDIAKIAQGFLVEGGELDTITKAADPLFLRKQDIIDMGARNIDDLSREQVVTLIEDILTETRFGPDEYERLQQKFVGNLGFPASGTIEQQLDQFAAYKDILEEYVRDGGIGFARQTVANFGEFLEDTTILNFGQSSGQRFFDRSNNNLVDDVPKEGSVITDTVDQEVTDSGDDVDTEKKESQKDKFPIENVGDYTILLLKESLGTEFQNFIGTPEGIKILGNAKATEQNIIEERNNVITLMQGIAAGLEEEGVDSEKKKKFYELSAEVIDKFGDKQRIMTEISADWAVFLYEENKKNPGKNTRNSKIAQQKAIVKAAGMDVTKYKSNREEAAEKINDEITIDGRPLRHKLNIMQAKYGDSNLIGGLSQGLISGGFAIDEAVQLMAKKVSKNPVQYLGINADIQNPLATRKQLAANTIMANIGELGSIVLTKLTSDKILKGTIKQSKAAKKLGLSGMVPGFLDETIDTALESSLGYDNVTTADVLIGSLLSSIAQTSTIYTARTLRDPNKRIPTNAEFETDIFGNTYDGFITNIAENAIDDRKRVTKDLRDAEIVDGEIITQEDADAEPLRQRTNKPVDQINENTAGEAEIDEIIGSNKTPGEKVSLVKQIIHSRVGVVIKDFVGSLYGDLVEAATNIIPTKQNEQQKIGTFKQAVIARAQSIITYARNSDLPQTEKQRIETAALVEAGASLGNIEKEEQSSAKRKESYPTFNDVMDRAFGPVIQAGHHVPMNIAGFKTPSEASNPDAVVTISGKIADAFDAKIQESRDHKYDKNVNHAAIQRINDALRATELYAEKDVKTWSSVYNMMKVLPEKARQSLSDQILIAIEAGVDPALVAQGHLYAIMGDAAAGTKSDYSYESETEASEINSEIVSSNKRMVADSVLMDNPDAGADQVQVQSYIENNKKRIDDSTKSLVHITLLDKDTENKPVAQEIRQEIESTPETTNQLDQIVTEVAKKKSKKNKLDVLEKLHPALSSEATDLQKIKDNIKAIPEQDINAAVTMLIGAVPDINTDYLSDPIKTVSIIKAQATNSKGFNQKKLNQWKRILTAEALLKIQREDIVQDTALGYIMLQLGVLTNLKFVAGGSLDNVIVHNTAAKYVDYYKKKKLRAGKRQAFELSTGDVIFVVGPHRSGKSTFLSSLQGGPYTIVDGDNFIDDQYSNDKKKRIANNKKVKAGVAEAIKNWDGKDILVINGLGAEANTAGYMQLFRDNGNKGDIAVLNMRRQSGFDPSADQVDKEGIQRQENEIRKLDSKIGRKGKFKNVKLVNDQLQFTTKAQVIAQDFVKSLNDIVGSDIFGESSGEAVSYSNGKVSINPKKVSMGENIADYPQIGLAVMKAKKPFFYYNLVSQYLQTNAAKALIQISNELMSITGVAKITDISVDFIPTALANSKDKNIQARIKRIGEEYQKLADMVEKDVQKKLPTWKKKGKRLGNHVAMELQDSGLLTSGVRLYDLMNDFAVFETFAQPEQTFNGYMKRELIIKKAKLLGISTWKLNQDNLYGQIGSVLNKISGTISGIHRNIAISLATDLQDKSLYTKLLRSESKDGQMIMSTLQYLENLGVLQFSDQLRELVAQDKYKRIVILESNKSNKTINKLPSQIKVQKVVKENSPTSVIQNRPGAAILDLAEESNGYSQEFLSETIFISLGNANVINGTVVGLEQGYGLYISDNVDKDTGKASVIITNRSKPAIDKLIGLGLDESYAGAMYATEDLNQSDKKKIGIEYMKKDTGVVFSSMNEVLQKTDLLGKAIGQTDGKADKQKEALLAEMDRSADKDGSIVYGKYVGALKKFMLDLGYQINLPTDGSVDDMLSIKMNFTNEELIDAIFAPSPSALENNAAHILGEMGYEVITPVRKRSMINDIVILADALVSRGMALPKDLMHNLAVIYPLLQKENRGIREVLSESKGTVDRENYDNFVTFAGYTYKKQIGIDENGDVIYEDIAGNVVDNLRNIVLSMNDSNFLIDGNGKIAVRIGNQDPSLEASPIVGEDRVASEDLVESEDAGGASFSYWDSTKDQAILLLHYLAEKIDTIQNNEGAIVTNLNNNGYFNATVLQYMSGIGNANPKVGKKNSIAANKAAMTKGLQGFYKDQLRLITEKEKTFGIRMNEMRGMLAEKMNMYLEKLRPKKDFSRFKPDTGIKESEKIIQTALKNKKSGLKSFDGKAIDLFDKFKVSLLPLVGLEGSLTLDHITAPSLGLIGTDNMFLNMLGIPTNLVGKAMDNIARDEAREQYDKVILDSTGGGSDLNVLRRETAHAQVLMQGIESVWQYAIESYIDLTGILSEGLNGFTEASLYARESVGSIEGKRHSGMLSSLIRKIDTMAIEGKTSEEIVSSLRQDGVASTMLFRFGIVLPTKAEGSKKFLDKLQDDAKQAQKTFKGMIDGLLTLRNNVEKNMKIGVYPNEGNVGGAREAIPLEEAQALVNQINKFFSVDIFGVFASGVIEGDALVQAKNFTQLAKKVQAIVVGEAQKYMGRVQSDFGIQGTNVLRNDDGDIIEIAEANPEQGDSDIGTYLPSQSILTRTIMRMEPFVRDFRNEDGSIDYDGLATKYFQIEAAKSLIGEVDGIIGEVNSETFTIGEFLAMARITNPEASMSSVFPELDAEALEIVDKMDMTTKLSVALNTFNIANVNLQDYSYIVGNIGQYVDNVTEVKSRIAQLIELKNGERNNNEDTGQQGLLDAFTQELKDLNKIEDLVDSDQKRKTYIERRVDELGTEINEIDQEIKSLNSAKQKLEEVYTENIEYQKIVTDSDVGPNESNMDREQSRGKENARRISRLRGELRDIESGKKHRAYQKEVEDFKKDVEKLYESKVKPIGFLDSGVKVTQEYKQGISAIESKYSNTLNKMKELRNDIQKESISMKSSIGFLPIEQRKEIYKICG